MGSSYWLLSFGVVGRVDWHHLRDLRGLLDNLFGRHFGGSVSITDQK